MRTCFGSLNDELVQLTATRLPMIGHGEPSTARALQFQMEYICYFCQFDEKHEWDDRKAHFQNDRVGDAWRRRIEPLSLDRIVWRSFHAKEACLPLIVPSLYLFRKVLDGATTEDRLAQDDLTDLNITIRHERPSII